MGVPNRLSARFTGVKEALEHPTTTPPEPGQLLMSGSGLPAAENLGDHVRERIAAKALSLASTLRRDIFLPTFSFSRA